MVDRRTIEEWNGRRSMRGYSFESFDFRLIVERWGKGRGEESGNAMRYMTRSRQRDLAHAESLSRSSLCHAMANRLKSWALFQDIS
jgi:hypothetical protein